MRLAFFLREAIRGLGRSSAPALAATLTIVLTALVLGVFIPIVQATTGTANEVRGRVVVDVYIKDTATTAERTELRSKLESTANVKDVEYISKDAALRKAQEKNPEAFERGSELLGANPLPASYRVTPEDPDELQAIVDRLAPDGKPALAAIDDVRNREEDTDKILSATGLVKILTAGLAALLIFAWPFVIEGMIVGFMGGVIAVLLLTIFKETFVDPLSERFELLAAPETIDFPLLIALLMVACVAVSALGSGITLRRFLRV